MNSIIQIYQIVLFTLVTFSNQLNIFYFTSNVPVLFVVGIFHFAVSSAQSFLILNVSDFYFSYSAITQIKYLNLKINLFDL
jgi:hypothetical protein